MQHNLKLGYWTVGQQLFINKAQALLAASANNLDVEYHFNDEVFSCHNWQIRSGLDLSTLYQQRAQQIRDRYDYIVAFYSAGADSTNMIRTFLDNDIVIDEILTYGSWNHSVTKDHAANAEFTNAGQSLIEEASHKGTQFYHHNFLDEFSSRYVNSEWILHSGSILAGYNDFWDSLYTLPRYKKLADSGKSICFLRGIDKPRISVNRTHYLLMYWDNRASEMATYHSYQTSGITTVWFYADPDCLDLITEQCHTFLDFIESKWSTKDCQRQLLTYPYEILLSMNKVLYPSTWDPTTFTVGKYPDMNPIKWTWFSNDARGTNQHKNYQGAVQDLFRSIDPRFSSTKHGLKPLFKMYPIRPLLV